jgi:hypothetical protein
MKTIETIALGTIFPEKNIEAVMEVVNATPNPPLALNILLGLYEEPMFLDYAKIGDRECIFKHYDKWTNTVHYTYEKNKQKYIYVHKDLDTNVITADNYTEYSVKYSNDTKGFYVTLHELETIDGTVLDYEWVKYEYPAIH